MSWSLLSCLSTIYTRMYNFIKTTSPFVIEASMVTLYFGAIVGRYVLMI
ncbi:uncharacterized protein LOC111519410 [Drosophila willistoni]|nr:uncharacterized protein LOC111519410 [Drosophila willistoni]